MTDWDQKDRTHTHSLCISLSSDVRSWVTRLDVWHTGSVKSVSAQDQCFHSTRPIHSILIITYSDYLGKIMTS